MIYDHWLIVRHKDGSRTVSRPPVDLPPGPLASNEAGNLRESEKRLWRHGPKDLVGVKDLFPSKSNSDGDCRLLNATIRPGHDSPLERPGVNIKLNNTPAQTGQSLLTGAWTPTDAM